MTGEFRPTTFVTEVAHHLSAHRLRTGLLLAAVTALVATMIVIELLWSSRLLVAEERFVTAGGYTAYLGPDESLSADACDAAREHSFVDASGGITQREEIRSQRQPNTRYAVYALTSGALEVIAPGAEAPKDLLGQVVLGAAAADELGLAVGGHLDVAGEIRRVGWVIPSDRLRVERLGRALLLPDEAAETVDACWLDLPSARFASAIAASSAMIIPPTLDARFEPYTGRGLLATTPEQALQDRGQRWSWLIVGLALGTVFGLDALARRSELALLRSIGVTLSAAIALHAAEKVAITWFGLVAGTSAGIAITHLLDSQPTGPQLMLGLRTAALAIVLALAAAAISTSFVALRSGIRTLKDR